MTLPLICTSVVIMAVAMWFLAPSSFFGYVIGLASGITMILSVVRQLGRKAQKSLIASAVFQKITKYRATVFVIHRQPYNVSVTVYGDADDYQSLIDILKRQMRFPPDMASQAAKYAMDTAFDKPLQEKLRVALQSLDATRGQNNVATGD